MIKLRVVVSTVCLALLGVQSAFAELGDELARCASITLSDTRLQCYDQLAKTALDAQSANAAAQQATSVSPSDTSDQTNEQLPARLGGARYEKQANVPELNSRGRVVKCTQSFDKKWFFHFENGQVWKQSDAKNRRYRDCDFMVTVSKDFLGYIMKIDDKKGKVRIKRRR